MPISSFSLVPESRIAAVLKNLQEFTELTIRLIDSNGNLVMCFGTSASYCSLLNKYVFKEDQCLQHHIKAEKTAQLLGEAYIFDCQASLNHIAFPLLNNGNLLGNVIVGPFLIGQPDSTMVTGLADRYHLSAALSLELFNELSGLVTLSPTKVNQLKILIDNLLSPLLPGERALLLENQEKTSQQSCLNETIQVFEKQNTDQSLEYFYKMEHELLARVRYGTAADVKETLNNLIGYVQFSEGGKLEAVRIRSIELTSLLSRVAVDGGVSTDSISCLRSQFIQTVLLHLYVDRIGHRSCRVLFGFLAPCCVIIRKSVKQDIFSTFANNGSFFRRLIVPQVVLLLLKNDFG